MAARATSIEHVIWDWNGTLLDDAWLCVDVMNVVLRSRQLPPLTPERYETIFDFPVIRYYERLGFDFAKDPFEVVGTEFIRLYETRRHEAQLRPEARAMLETLRARGIRQSVLSAYRHDTLESLLTHHGVRAYFEHVIGSDDHYANGKVDQGRRFIAHLGVAPTSVLMVGDTIHDHEVAIAMGVECLLIYGGSQSVPRLATTGAPVIKDLHGVAARLGMALAP